MSIKDNDRKWHVDHSIPLALVAAIACQTLIGVWWISSFQTQTVSDLRSLELQQKVLNLLPERMARQEAQIESATAMLRDIRSDMRDWSKRGGK